jgi:hypothetical protein
MLKSQQASSIRAMEGLKPQDRKEFEDDIKLQSEAYYTSIAELLGRGFDVALKPNLEFDAAGNPSGVRAVDRPRFPQCHAALTSGGKKTKTKKKSKRKPRKTKKYRR